MGEVGKTGKYRLVPHGLTQWRVQGRWLFMWRDIGRWVGYEFWEPYVFESEDEARKWIQESIIAEIERITDRQAERSRKRNVAPIEL